MKVLFVHQNFPSQFKFLAPKLASLGHDVSAFTLRQNAPGHWKGVKLLSYSIDRENAQNAHPWTVDFESKVVRGEACCRAAITLRKRGYYPDIIIAHPGWGESLFLKQVWPNSILKLYCEYFYRPTGQDVGFDPEFANADEADAGRVFLKNANILVQFEQSESGISPTRWQAQTFPERLRGAITTLHDGVDTVSASPNQSAKFHVDENLTLSKADEVITFVNRTLEPYRGFHVFMRSLPKLLADRPTARVLIVGSDGRGYGELPREGGTWKQKMLAEITPRLGKNESHRIYFLGNLEYKRYLNLLRVSTVHVYLTYPFILGWSLLEAMSSGCAIIGSDTPPVTEVIENGKTGLITPFFDHEALATSISELLQDDEKRDRLGRDARALVVRDFDLQSVCLPQQINWATRT
tara:strand:- start:939 stop:2165 length:1227 start_codon:yes stop_codon:yes gene_type:complete